VNTFRVTQFTAGVAGTVLVTAMSLVTAQPAAARPKDTAALKQAKLIIEHNATDNDTGFQGFLDSEGWQSLDLVGPGGFVLHLDGKGDLGRLGLTELFFETVEPANVDVPLAEVLASMLPGEYSFRGRGIEAGEATGDITGTALLTHTIPAGPQLLWPASGATVPHADLLVQWSPVMHSLMGGPVNIIAYQLIIERDTEPHPHMIGKWGLSMYLPASTTSMAVPRSFLEPNTAYAWEVLAIEESGNQTLSSGTFRTQ
jgi:hypothetical protein